MSPDLSVPGAPHIFVTGDLAAVPYKDGQLVPGVAPAANQMGKLAAKNIRRLLADLPTLTFKYRDKGNLATIGRYRAIAEIGRFKLRGQFAWWFWLIVHLMYLATFRNRIDRAHRVGVLVSDVSARLAIVDGGGRGWGVGEVLGEAARGGASRLAKQAAPMCRVA